MRSIIRAFKLFEGWQICLNLDSLQGAFWEGRKALAPQALTVFKADRAYDMNDLSKVTDDSSYKEDDQHIASLFEIRGNVKQE